MREFGKPKKKSFWENLSNFLAFFLIRDRESSGFNGHNERMEKRRRKTKFDKWGR